MGLKVICLIVYAYKKSGCEKLKTIIKKVLHLIAACLQEIHHSIPGECGQSGHTL